jgi:hypothetical protein
MPYTDGVNINLPVLTVDSTPPMELLADEPITIEAEVNSTDALYSVNIIYQHNSDAKDSKIMDYNATNCLWQTTIGPFAAGDHVSYYVSATDNSGRRERSSTTSGSVISNIYEAENAVLSGVVVSKTVSGYSGTGYVDYIHASNDYVQWTVNVPVAGQYKLQFRYGLLSGNRPLAIMVNGTVVAERLAFPATGSWTNWSTVSIMATLNSGTNTVRATAIGKNGANVDYLKVIPVVIYEAENAVLSGAVVSKTVSGYSGTGYVDYIHASNDYVQWTVNVPVAGQYELQFRYGLLSGNRPLAIMVNGTVVAERLAFPATGSWTNWSTVSIMATLNSGTNTVRATAIGKNGANVDYMKVIGN